ncbi:MAG: hypothetical protein HY394_00365 [Candidatus Diapherotrites archaeon]|nr:hypothetical protein [Candidatus Diapherotrites archaeon]
MVLVRKGFSALFIAALLFLAGCVNDRVSIGERQLCVDLTSKSFALVPECSTQEKCFESVEKSFFGFEQDFAPEISQELYYYKNHAALSWLYLNFAQKNLKAMNEACRNASNPADLSFQINSFSHNLERAFDEAQNALQKAEAVLLLEKSFLEGEGIGLAKEEPLFADHVLLAQNANDLQEGKANNSSFSGFVALQAQKFSALAEQNGFSPVAQREFSLLDFLGRHDSALEKKAVGNGLYLPIISDFVGNVIDALSRQAKFRSAIETMKNFPAFGFFESYNDFLGERNSAAEKFSQILKAEQSHKAELVQRNSEILEENLGMADKLLERSQNISDSLPEDNGFLAELGMTRQTHGISSGSLEITSAKELAEKALPKIIAAKQEMLELKSGLKRLSLGGTAGKLKETLNSLKSIETEIAFFEDSFGRQAEFLCERKTEEISDSLEKEKNLPEGIAGLKERALFYSKKFAAEKSGAEKIRFCGKAFSSFKDFEAAKKNFAAFRAGQEELLSDCHGFLKKAFSEKSLREKLSGFLPRLEILESVEFSEQQMLMVRNACESLREDALRALSDSDEARNAAANLSGARETVASLLAISSVSPKALAPENAQAFEEELQRLGQKISNGKLTEKGALELDELENEAADLKSDAEESLADAIRAFFAERFSLEAFAEQPVEAGKPAEARFVLAITNPFGGFDRPVEIDFPFSSNFARFESLPANVSGLSQEGKSLAAEFKSIPQGTTRIEFFAVLSVRAEEETQAFFAGNGQAFVEKKIALSADAGTPKFRLQTYLLGENFSKPAANVFAIRNNAELKHWLEGNKISFDMENLAGKENVMVYFTVRDAVSVQTSVLEKTAFEANSSRLKALIKVSNVLPIEVEDVFVQSPFPAAGNVSGLAVTDETGKKIETSQSGAMISFRIPLLPALREKSFNAEFAVFDEQTYWSSLLAETENRLEKLVVSQNPAVAAKAEELLAEVQEMEAAAAGFSSKERIQKISDISKEASELQQKENAESESAMLFAEMKKAVQKEIDQKKAAAAELEENGFAEEAGQARQSISGAEQLLLAAESESKKSGPEKGISSLYAAKARLAETPNGLNQALHEKQLLLKESLEKMLPELRANALDANAENALAIASDAERETFKGNLAGAKKLTDSLAENLFDLNIALEKAVEKKSLENETRAKEFLEKIEKTVPEKFALVANALSGVTMEELAAIAYVPPMTSERLGQLELELEALDSEVLKAGLEGIFNENRKRDFRDAVELFEKQKAKFLRSVDRLDAIEKETGKALALMKEDATVQFNSAAENANSGRQNPEAIVLAKKEFEKGHYLKAIVLLNSGSGQNATGFAGMQNLPVPAILAPIAIAAALLFAVRKKREKGEAEKKETENRILKNW